MVRPIQKALMVGAILLGTIATGSPQAEACGWCWGWWGACRPACSWSPCYTPCSTVSYGACCDTGSWYVGLRPGPVRRLLLGPYRWYYGPWGWSSGCCDAGGWEIGEVAQPAATFRALPEGPTMAPKLPGEPPGESAEVETSTVEDTEPALPGVPPPGPGTTDEGTEPGAPGVPPPGPTTLDVRHGSGVLSIRVPAGAKVIVNGRETKSTGIHREYVSYGLRPGFVYKYEIRARMVQNGRLVEDVRTAYLTTGGRQEVAFDLRRGLEEGIATLGYGAIW